MQPVAEALQTKRPKKILFFTYSARHIEGGLVLCSVVRVPTTELATARQTTTVDPPFMKYNLKVYSVQYAVFIYERFAIKCAIKCAGAVQRRLQLHTDAAMANSNLSENTVLEDWTILL